MADCISPSHDIVDVENAGEDGQERDGVDGEAEMHQSEGQEDQRDEAQEERAEDEGQEEDAINADAEEEAERPRGLRDPGKPSKSEIEEHEITHIPFRLWCSACILGRAKDKLHMRLAGGVRRQWSPSSSDGLLLHYRDEP